MNDMIYSEDAEARWSPEWFVVDLNAVRDDNLVVTLVGFTKPQRVPYPGEDAIAIDEDRNSYDAVVEAVLPDNRVYLRIDWATRRRADVPVEMQDFDAMRVSVVSSAVNE